MPTFVQKQKSTQQTPPAKSTILGRAHSGQSREVNSILHLQRTIGHQALQQLLQKGTERLEFGPAIDPSTRVAHDASQIPARSSSGFNFSFTNVRAHPLPESEDTTPVRQLETIGSVLDQDTGAALNGQDAAPEPELLQEVEGPEGDHGEVADADPTQQGGKQPVETETAAASAEAEEGDGCAKSSDQAGILALISKAKAPAPVNTIAYGFTFWAASGITYPTVEFDWKKSGKKWTASLKRTTADMGTVEALYLKPGIYKTPRKITAHGPACGKSGKKVDFFSQVDKNISGLAKMAEQEHCNDYKHAFNLSYGKWASIINSIAGTTFGPGSRKQVQALVLKELKAKGDKGRRGWIREAIRLKNLSLQRDQGDHSMKPDGSPVVNTTCTRVDGTSVKGSRTNIPGPSSKTLIK